MNLSAEGSLGPRQFRDTPSHTQLRLLYASAFGALYGLTWALLIVTFPATMLVKKHHNIQPAIEWYRTTGGLLWLTFGWSLSAWFAGGWSAAVTFGGEQLKKMAHHFFAPIMVLARPGNVALAGGPVKQGTTAGCLTGILMVLAVVALRMYRFHKPPLPSEALELGILFLPCMLSGFSGYRVGKKEVQIAQRKEAEQSSQQGQEPKLLDSFDKGLTKISWMATAAVPALLITHGIGRIHHNWVPFVVVFVLSMVWLFSVVFALQSKINSGMAERCGIQGRALTSDELAARGLHCRQAIVVEDITKGSIAERLSVRTGDVLPLRGGKMAMGIDAQGDEECVTLTVWRDGHEMTLRAKAPWTKEDIAEAERAFRERR